MSCFFNVDNFTTILYFVTVTLINLCNYPIPSNKTLAHLHVQLNGTWKAFHYTRRFFSFLNHWLLESKWSLFFFIIFWVYIYYFLLYTAMGITRWKRGRSPLPWIIDWGCPCAVTMYFSTIFKVSNNSW